MKQTARGRGAQLRMTGGRREAKLTIQRRGDARGMRADERIEEEEKRGMRLRPITALCACTRGRGADAIGRRELEGREEAKQATENEAPCRSQRSYTISSDSSIGAHRSGGTPSRSK